jgi:hypothetical protein
MELVCSNEQSYQLELHAYQTTFLDFKYEPSNFIFVEIETTSKIPTMPSVVQLVAITKLINPRRGGTCLEIIPLPIQTFTALVPITTIVSKLIEDNKRCDKE